jgi:hypothetical protein
MFKDKTSKKRFQNVVAIAAIYILYGIFQAADGHRGTVFYRGWSFFNTLSRFFLRQSPKNS